MATWYMVVKSADGSEVKLEGADLAPDIKAYIDHFVNEVEQHKGEQDAI